MTIRSIIVKLEYVGLIIKYLKKRGVEGFKSKLMGFHILIYYFVVD